MPVYKWEGRTRTGELKRGTMEAPNEQAVILRLKQQQINPSNISEVKNILAKLSELEIPGMQAKVTLKSLVVFTRQFATMIDAGLPLVQGLEILASQSDDKALQKVLYEIKNDVETGSTLSGAMAKHPDVFDTLYIALVSAGEMGGILDTILDRLATYMENAQRLRGKVKSALMYPMIVLVVAVGVIAILMVFVIPVFAKMFAEMGNRELPGPTQLVMNMSEFMQNNIGLMLITIAAVIMVYKALMKIEIIAYGKDWLLLHMPVIGNVIRKSAVARFTRTLGTMISSGVPILQGLDVVQNTAGNKVIEKGIIHVKERISEGKSMAEPLMATGVFPSMVVQMIAVGESTGSLDSMLGKIADFYDEEVSVAVDGMTSMIEPLMMVFLGGAVAFILIAMYLPVFQLAQNM